MSINLDPKIFVYPLLVFIIYFQFYVKMSFPGQGYKRNFLNLIWFLFEKIKNSLYFLYSIFIIFCIIGQYRVNLLEQWTYKELELGVHLHLLVSMIFLSVRIFTFSFILLSFRVNGIEKNENEKLRTSRLTMYYRHVWLARSRMFAMWHRLFSGWICLVRSVQPDGLGFYEGQIQISEWNQGFSFDFLLFYLTYWTNIS